MKKNIPAMMKDIVFLLLLSGSICAAQSTLVTPAADVQQNPDDTSTSNPRRTQQQVNAQQRNDQGGGVPDLSRDTTDMLAPSNAGSPNRPAERSSRIVGPLRTKSEFQQYAEDATGRQLPVYGRQLFDLVPTTFAPVENVPVPADY
jgi:hypothetical protein